MKAILIIDVDDNADFEKAIADITFRDEWGVAPRGIKRWYSGVKAKPLPKYEMLEESDIVNTNDMWQKIGWNNCLRNIIGEE